MASNDYNDLANFAVWVIARFPQAGPDNEFEIIGKEGLINPSKEKLKKGTNVIKKSDKLPGIVIAISDFYEELVDNFDDIVKEYKEGAKGNGPAVSKPRVSPPGNSSRQTYQHLEEVRALQTQSNLKNLQREMREFRENYSNSRERYKGLLHKSNDVEANVKEKLRNVQTVQREMREWKKNHNHLEERYEELLYKLTNVEAGVNDKLCNLQTVHREMRELNKNRNQLEERYHELRHKLNNVEAGADNKVNDLQNPLNNLKNLAAVVDVKQQQRTPSKINRVKRSCRSVNEHPSTSNKENDDPNMVVIEKRGSKIPRSVYETLQYNNYTAAVRGLLTTFFSREVLASSSLTGNESHAFIGRGKQPKKQLDPVIVDDIVDFLSVKCGVKPSLIRAAITSKCADESKMLKKHQLQKEQQENSGTDTQN